MIENGVTDAGFLEVIFYLKVFKIQKKYNELNLLREYNLLF